MVSGKEPMHQVMADLLAYAIEPSSARFKGETHIVTPDTNITADRTMKVARLQYPGNYDPEPGGWRRMAAIMHNEQKIDLTVEPVMLGEGKLDQATYALGPPHRNGRI